MSLQDISGWGRNPRIQASTTAPSCSDDTRHFIEHKSDEPWIPQGCRRSYGDAALASQVLQSQNLEGVLNFDPSVGRLKVESGVQLHTILPLIEAQGWTLPVLPGTGFVSVGGAIAGDVHGKSHHQNGNFSSHLLGMDLLTPDGTVHLTPEQSLFNASCGGLGLTGFIQSANLQLQALEAPYIRETRSPLRNLDDTVDRLLQSTAPFNAAWLDTTSGEIGNGILHEGWPSHEPAPSRRINLKATIPLVPPFSLLQPWLIRSFNRRVHASAERQPERILRQSDFHWPLDLLLNWNRLYGPNGFYQFQCVLPHDHPSAFDFLRRLLKDWRALGATLCVLKELGSEGQGWLSFPTRGLTLAIDLPAGQLQKEAIRQAIKDLRHLGGRVNPIKDCLMNKDDFFAMYPKAQAMKDLRASMPKPWRPASLLSQRLGLDP